MKTVAPSYYEKFKCIGGKCKHSCCIGWEIDIDEEILEFYKNVGGEFGERLKSNIEYGDCPHFKLSENERCPFLNENNLCDIIINLGEEKLCEICDSHPRFRNFYSDRVEIGLGLCCEAAVELILSTDEKMALVVISDDGEGECDDIDEAFFAAREEIFAIVQDRNMSICERLHSLQNKFSISFNSLAPSKWVDRFLKFEMLDSNFGVMLNKLSDDYDAVYCKSENAAEQLLMYFLYRHLPNAIYDGRLFERIKLSVLSTKMILSLSSACEIPLAESARIYSSEIEYSEENTEKLIDLLK